MELKISGNGHGCVQQIKFRANEARIQAWTWESREYSLPYSSRSRPPLALAKLNIPLFFGVRVARVIVATLPAATTNILLFSDEMLGKPLIN